MEPNKLFITKLPNEEISKDIIELYIQLSRTSKEDSEYSKIQKEIDNTTNILVRRLKRDKNKHKIRRYEIDEEYMYISELKDKSEVLNYLLTRSEYKYSFDKFKNEGYMI